MEPEYKLITAEQMHCQKLLNQWKHDYTLEIITIIPVAKGNVFMVLKRTPK